MSKNKENSNANSSSKNNGFPQDNKYVQPKPSILVLLIKADEANSSIEKIKQKGTLYEGVETMLFVSTMKMWAGTNEQYKNSFVKNEFSREENNKSFVKEYDYIAMKFKLPENNSYIGFRKGDDSYERNLFFTQICIDKVILEECSTRLSFDENLKTDAYDVY